MIAYPPTHPDVVDGVYYPSSDGKPMAETPIHGEAMDLLKQALEDFFGDRQDVFIGKDNFWYWKKGDPSACRAPDVFVVLGVDRRRYRRSFRSWEDGGGVPAVCWEMASENTWRENLDETRVVYERTGVREYFIFDPEHEFLSAPLLGFRLDETGVYQPVDADEDGGLICQQLNLRMIPEGTMIRLVDLANGAAILTRHEQVEKASRRAEFEKQRADQLEAEVARLRAAIAAQKPNGHDSSPPSTTNGIGGS